MRFSPSLLFLLAPAALFAQSVPVPAPTEPAVAADFALGPDAVLDRYLAAQAEFDAQLGAILALPDASRDFENTLQALETASSRRDDVVRALSLLGSVSPDRRVREAAQLVQEDANRKFTELWTRRDLYRAVAAVAAKEPPLAGEDKALLETIQSSFENNGAHLPPEQAAKFKAAQDRLAALAAKFQANVNEYEDRLELSAEELKGLPKEDLDRLERTDDGKFIVTLDQDDCDAVLKHVENPEIRKAAVAKYHNRSSQNLPILSEMLKLRKDAAALMGLPSYADWELSGDRMMRSTDEVLSLLNRVWKGLRGKTEAGLDAMLALKRLDDPTAEAIEAWDKDYYGEKLKKRAFDFDPEEVKPYFPTDRTLRGVMDVYQDLLGVRFSEVPDANVWAPDVKLFEVSEAATGRRLAHFYLDLYPRKGKFKWFAVFDVVKGRELPGGGYNEPVAMMVANFSRPSPGRPALLRHDEVETFFHEFGHLMHETLTKARYASHAGMNVEQDFLESPSQMLENFAWDRAILDRISGHWRDPSRKLPPELLDKMAAARSFNAGVRYCRQIALSMIDMLFHMATPAHTSALFNQVMSLVSGIDSPRPSSCEAAWDHLMDYAAAYYGYLRAEITSDDLFERFRNEGLLNPATGASYRKEILEAGGTRPAEDSIRAFLGREPSEAPFLRRVLGTHTLGTPPR